MTSGRRLDDVVLLQHALSSSLILGAASRLPELSLLVWAAVSERCGMGGPGRGMGRKVRVCRASTGAWAQARSRKRGPQSSRGLIISVPVPDSDSNLGYGACCY